MKLKDVLNSSLVKINSSSRTKSDIINEIASLGAAVTGLSEEVVSEALLKREKLMSTGIGNNLAIPHAQFSEIDRFYAGVLTLMEPVDFDSIDQNPVKLVIFVLAPEGKSKQQLSLLSSISQIIRAQGVLENAVNASNENQLMHSLHCDELLSANIPETEGHVLFHIFVQNEDHFMSILQILTSMDTTQEIVIEAQNASNYLTRMPLFADFMSGAQERSCNVIIALVERKLFPETLRQIELTTGKLENCRDVMVTVQELLYANGMIQP